MNRRDAIKLLASAGTAAGISLPSVATEKSVPATLQPLKQNDLEFWLETTLKRVYPGSPSGNAE